MRLDELAAGQSARLLTIGELDGLGRRLRELGFVPGARVDCLDRRRGALAAYRVSGTVLCLRESDARGLLVSEGEG